MPTFLLIWCRPSKHRLLSKHPVSCSRAREITGCRCRTGNYLPLAPPARRSPIDASSALIRSSRRAAAWWRAPMPSSSAKNSALPSGFGARHRAASRGRRGDSARWGFNLRVPATALRRACAFNFFHQRARPCSRQDRLCMSTFWNARTPSSVANIVCIRLRSYGLSSTVCSMALPFNLPLASGRMAFNTKNPPGLGSGRGGGKSDFQISRSG